jgi:hypothetical protein
MWSRGPSGVAAEDEVLAATVVEAPTHLMVLFDRPARTAERHDLCVKSELPIEGSEPARGGAAGEGSATPLRLRQFL